MAPTEVLVKRYTSFWIATKMLAGAQGCGRFPRARWGYHFSWTPAFCKWGCVQGSARLVKPGPRAIILKLGCALKQMAQRGSRYVRRYLCFGILAQVWTVPPCCDDLLKWEFPKLRGPNIAPLTSRTTTTTTRNSWKLPSVPSRPPLSRRRSPICASLGALVILKVVHVAKVTRQFETSS